MIKRIGKYEIQAEIGLGGFGRVYRGFDPTVGRVVAIKVLLPDASDTESLTRFKMEATTAGNLHHPNLATIHEFGEENGSQFLVMEYLEGEELLKLIREHRPMPLLEKVEIMQQVAAGLHCAHENNIIHRDVKPSNIMVLKDNLVKLMDFGIARLARNDTTRMTKAGFLVGTLNYMSPEQFRDAEVDALCDIWAFGVIYYEFLTGRFPFAGTSTPAILYSITSEEPPAPSLLVPDCPEGLSQMIMKTLAKDRDLRYQSLHEFQLDVGPLLLDMRRHRASELLPQARALFEQERGEEAQRLVRRILELEPMNVEARQLRERIQRMAQQQTILPKVSALKRMGEEQLSQKRYAEAIQSFEHALRLDSANTEIRSLLEAVRNSVPQYKRAQELAEAAEVLAEHKDFEAAHDLLRQAFEVYPLNQRARKVMARVQHALESQKPRREVELALENDIGSDLRAQRHREAVQGIENEAVRAPKPPTPPPPPGEFTRMFNAQLLMASPTAPPKTSSSSGVSEPPGAASLGGEFTSLFQTIPVPLATKVSVPTIPISSATASESPDQSTKMFHVSLEPAAESGSIPETLVLPDVALTIQRCEDPAFVGRKTNVTKPVFRIGRSVDKADLVLGFDHAISHVHAEIVFENGGFWLQDMGSQNGTFLNGKRLDKTKITLLMYGSRIVLGSNTQLVFVSNEMTEMPDFTGSVIGVNRFCLKERLYSSAKSSVYLAEDQRFDTEAIVKILSPRMAAYPGYREQFEREAATAHKLFHAHICPVIDFGHTSIAGSASETLYIAMRKLGGTTLQQRLVQREALDLDRIATWLEKLASALDFIHRKLMTHGGIKPSAVVFDAEDNPYLTDFAFATTAGENHNRALIGTPAYLAPEQWETGLSTPASDRYAMGVLAYLLVTGFLPFDNQEDSAVRTMNLGRDPVPAHEIAARAGKPSVPPEISTVLARMLAVRPEARFDTAQAFTAAFRGSIQPTVSVVQVPPRPLIFISHQRSSSGWLAILIKAELEKREFRVFVDSQQADTVGRFSRKIEKNIDRSAVFICLVAQGTLTSKWVDREIQYAQSRSVPMIPVFQDTWAAPASIEDLPPHVQELLTYDAVEFRSFQRHQIEASLRWLVESVEQLVNPPD